MVPFRPVVVRQLLAGANRARRANPDRRVDDLEPAVRLAGVIDEARDVPADAGVAAPDATDAEHPDTPLRQIPRLAHAAAAIANQFARLVDDACVLGDRFGREYTEAVQLRTLADKSRQFPRLCHSPKSYNGTRHTIVARLSKSSYRGARRDRRACLVVPALSACCAVKCSWTGPRAMPGPIATPGTAARRPDRASRRRACASCRTGSRTRGAARWDR